MFATAILALAMHPVPYWRWMEQKRATAARQTHTTVAAGPESIVVGHQRLHRCNPLVPGYCGFLKVPLNWLDDEEGTINVRFEWIPARETHAKATIVAQEGGPGYASTGTGINIKHCSRRY